DIGRYSVPRSRLEYLHPSLGDRAGCSSQSSLLWWYRCCSLWYIFSSVCSLAAWVEGTSSDTSTLFVESRNPPCGIRSGAIRSWGKDWSVPAAATSRWIFGLG